MTQKLGGMGQGQSFLLGAADAFYDLVVHNQYSPSTVCKVQCGCLGLLFTEAQVKVGFNGEAFLEDTICM